MTDHKCIADESGRCFECDRPVLRIVGEPFLPEWARYFAQNCPQEDIDQLNEAIESDEGIEK